VNGYGGPVLGEPKQETIHTNRTGRADAKRPIPQALPAEITAEWGFRYMHQQIAQTPEGQRKKLLEEATQVTDAYDTFINRCPALIGCVYDVSRLPHPKERIMVAICLVSCVADDSALRERLGFLLESLARFQKGVGATPIGTNVFRVMIGLDGHMLTAEEVRSRSKEETEKHVLAIARMKPVPPELKKRVELETKEYSRLQLAMETLRLRNVSRQ
jgi:hypothetical protein